MLLEEILNLQQNVDNSKCVIEEVWCDESGEILSEASVRQFKRYGQRMVKKYRCLAGPKKGKLVAHAGDCATRKEPKKVRQGRKLMRSKKGIIARKSKISKRKSFSRLVTKVNQRLMGNKNKKR